MMHVSSQGEITEHRLHEFATFNISYHNKTPIEYFLLLSFLHFRERQIGDKKTSRIGGTVFLRSVQLGL